MEPDSIERSPEESESQLQFEIAQELGVPESELELKNAAKFVEGSRFLYCFTTDGFGKVSNPETRRQLQKESVATAIAAELGAHTVAIKQPYREISGERGLFVVEQLNANDGLLLASPEMIAGLDDQESKAVGQAAAGEVMKLSSQPIPPDMDSSLLANANADWRLKSPDGLKAELSVRTTKLLDEKLKEYIDEIVGPVTTVNNGETEELSGFRYLERLNDELNPAIDRLSKVWPESTNEYFVHNDASPNNSYFTKSPDGSMECRLLDYEHAGKTNFQILALMTDLENYYGRLWPNPEAQRALIEQSFTSLAESCQSQDELDDRRLILRTIMIYGAFHLSMFPLVEALAMWEKQNAVEPDYSLAKAVSDVRNHPMAISLLSELDNNLSALDAQYFSVSESFRARTSLEKPELSPGE